MLSYEQILELIDKLVENPLTEISLTQGEFSVSLKKGSPQSENGVNTSIIGSPMQPYGVNIAPQSTAPLQVQPAATPALPLDNGVEVTSPMVGTFYAAPSPDSPSFVEVGQKVKPGDTLCIIE
jgi:acetyl-CoA carboxylase biotin carboxyl carrier protein